MRDAAAVFPLNDTERELFKDLPPDYEVALGPPPAYEETAGSRRQELPIDQPPPDYTPDWLKSFFKFGGIWLGW